MTNYNQLAAEMAERCAKRLNGSLKPGTERYEYWIKCDTQTILRELPLASLLEAACDNTGNLSRYAQVKYTPDGEWTVFFNGRVIGKGATPLVAIRNAMNQEENK